MKNFNIVVVETFNNIVHVRLSGTEYFGDWEHFSKEIFFPFDEERIVSINFEPERAHFTVERPLGVVDSGENVQELAWIRDNLEVIRVTAERLAPAETPILSGIIRRQQLFSDTEWLVQRHLEQTSASITTTLTEQQFQELLAYRQALREITTTQDLASPADAIVWPHAPDFL
jgi:hypothetical protein